MNYVQKGDLVVCIGNEECILSNNEYAVVNSNALHQTKGKYEDVHVKYMVIRYSYVFIKNYFPDIEKYQFEVKDHIYKEIIREQLERIADFIDSEDELSEMHILSSLINILDILFTHCKVLRSTDENLYESIVYDYAKCATEYIKEHYSEPITLKLVASVVGLSPTYFSKLFKIKTSKTFLVYLNDVRMARALADIENYGVSETEAALNNGFEDCICRE